MTQKSYLVVIIALVLAVVMVNGLGIYGSRVGVYSDGDAMDHEQFHDPDSSNSNMGPNSNPEDFDDPLENY